MIKSGLTIAVACMLVAGCGSAVTTSNEPTSRPSPIVLRAGADGLIDFAGGTYRVSWTADCASFDLEVAPANGTAPVKIPAPLPSGSVDVVIPAGPGYVNRGGSCAGDYTVTIARP